MALQDGHKSGSAALQDHARGSLYVAEALRKWMTREKLTRAQAAKRLGVVQSYISEITCNKVDKLSLDCLAGLCAKDGLTVLSGWSLSRMPY
ncbi:MAG: helix-turn-helix transcriptional regulator [Nitrospira sp.]|nr:helix-turn-helix transcriptional regulator [Nitrospira sp.]MBH0184438.1 helix-turn-helix transcriptional regulator [Nitrospira sp.]